MQELAGEWKRLLLDAIAHEAYRHSSEAEVARRADLHPRFLSQARKRGRIQLDQALALIAALGRDPGDFIARALGHTLPTPAPSPPPSAPHAFVERAYDRAQSRLPTTIPRSHLEHLSEQRESNPQRVLRAIEASLDHVAPEDVPFTLGIWSTLQRLQLDYEAADQAIQAGLELAADDPSLRGSLLLKREVLVKRLTHDWKAGERIATEVSELALQSGDSQLLGQSLLARMINARLQKNIDRAAALGEQALRLLPDGENRFFFIASLELAVNYAHLGRAHDSQRLVLPLTDRFSRSSPWEQTWFRWFQAGIADALGDPAEAEQAMEPIVESILPLDFEKATDAALDQALFISRQGEPKRSLRTLRALLTRCLGDTLAPDQLEQALDELPPLLDDANYDQVRKRLYQRIHKAQSVRLPTLSTIQA